MFEDFNFDDNLLPKISPVKRPTDSAPFDGNKNPKIPKNVVKRKFPGPAGILPDRKDFNFTFESPKTRSDEMPCSQTSLSVFQNGPWLEMSRDYEKLLEKFDIKWIKTRAGLNKLHNQKAPFLGAIIQNIECLDGKKPIVNVVLKDASGEIQGTIIHNLYEEYATSLVVGSVIVLKQFGVLTTGSNNNHYLTITLKNLVTIYVKNKDGESEVRVIKIQDISRQDLMRDFEQKSMNFQEKPIKDNQFNLKKNNALKDVNRLETLPRNESIFEDAATLPDNFDDCLLGEKQEQKFNFKKKSITISSSQVSVSTREEDSEIWQNALEGVDANSFFEDF